VRDLAPRKLPRQARSRATVDALLEACARLLAESEYRALTTNRIARRAGVSIGSLYEFFPNRESILLTLTQRRLARLERDVREALALAAAQRGGGRAVERVVRRVVDAVAADRGLYRVLLREAAFLRERPEIERAMAALLDLARVGTARAGPRALPDPDATSWLMGRMLAHAVLDVAFLDAGTPRRERLVRALVRLTARMLGAGDPAPARRAAQSPGASR
jgi:AcrR family transcriptional regulator